MSSGGRETGDSIMDIVFPCCAGLDVHKDTVVVCVRRLRTGAKHKSKSEVRTFGTMTEQILALADWLAEEGVNSLLFVGTGATINKSYFTQRSRWISF
jgi:transposase